MCKEVLGIFKQQGWVLLGPGFHLNNESQV
jgi:hypothetical protein